MGIKEALAIIDDLRAGGYINCHSLGYVGEIAVALCSGVDTPRKREAFNFLQQYASDQLHITDDQGNQLSALSDYDELRFAVATAGF